MEIEAVVGGLTKLEARSVEQVLINASGLQKEGGDLRNKINSIARKNWTAELQAVAERILHSASGGAPQP
jgi:hypothetical protein